MNRASLRFSALISIACACMALSLPFSARAADPDSASAEALAKTQALLQNPAERDKVVNQNPTAQTVDAQVKSLAGNPATTEDIYKVAGQVLEDLVKETGGDPVKMLQIVNQASSDPKSLMSHISKKNQEAIHAVSTQIENSPTTRQPASTP